MSATGLVGAMCASALAPVLAAAAGAGAVAIAGVGVLGSVGANVLSDVVTKAIEGLRGSGRNPSRDEIEAAVAASIERALATADSRAGLLRRDVAAVLRQTGAVAVAMEAVVEIGDPARQGELTDALILVGAELDEFGFVLAEIKAAAGTILRTLHQQNAEQRADRNRAHEIAVLLRLMLDKLSAIERQAGPGTAQKGAGTPVALWEGCPYRGLWPFEEDHEAVFYGRERLTAELITTLSARLTGLGMLVVTGASGAGKSSLLRAGLLPALARGSLVDAWARWPRIVLTPTRAPLEELAAHLAVLGRMDATAVCRDLAAAPDRAHLVVRQALMLSTCPDGRVVIVVDQFEELFTLAGEEQRAAFVAALHAAAATPTGPRDEPSALVVLGVRGDFWDRCAGYPQLVEALEAGPFVVGPMTEAELRNAINGPAAAAGLDLEPGLVDAVLGELRGASMPSAGTLPLLSQAMLVTWEHRAAGGLLTIRGYGQSGGIANAVQTSAEAAYGELTERQQDVARTIFRRLTVLSRDGRLARRQLARVDLDQTDDRGDVDAVLDRFVARRLISLHGDGVEIAHDVLLGAWERLRGWLDGDIADLALYDQLIDDAAAWVEKGRDDSFLYRGAQRTTASKAAANWRDTPDRFPPLTPAATEFLAACRRHDRRRTAARRGAFALIVVLLVVAGTAAVVLKQRTDELARQLSANAAQLLVTQSRERNRTDPAAAILAAAAAYRTSPDPAVLTNLSAEYLRYRSTTRLLAAETGPVSDVHVSADGRVVAALGARGRIALWRLDRQPAVPAYLGRGSLTHSALSWDGSLIVGADSAGRIEVWQADGTSVFQAEAGVALVPARTGLRFDPTGQRLLVIPARGGPKVWDLRLRQPVPVPAGLVDQFAPSTNDVWFGPRGESIAVATDADLTLWNLTTGASSPVSALDATGFATVSGDGLTAIACTGSAYTRWDLDPVRERDRQPIRNGYCGASDAWESDPTGNIAITGQDVETDGVASDHPRRVYSLRDLSTGSIARPVVPAGDGLTKAELAALPDGTRMVASVGSAVAVIDVPATDFTRMNTAMAESFTGPRALSDDGTKIALSAYTDGPGLTLWDIDSGRELARSTDVDGTLLGFLDENWTLVALDAEWKHLVVREVPSLKVMARLPLPVAPGVRRPTHPLNAFSGLCGGTDEASPDTITVFFGGLITRFSIRSGTQIGEPIRPWRTEEELDRLAHSGRCAIAPGADAMAIDVDEQFVETWDLSGGNRVRTVDPPALGTLADIGLSADGRLMAMLDNEGLLQVWDLEQDTRVATPQRVSAPTRGLRIVAFPGPGRVVVETESRIIIWDLERQAAIGEFDLHSARSTLSLDGNTLHVVGAKWLSRIPIDPETWVVHLCRIVGRDMTDAERQALVPGSFAGSICPQTA